MSDPFIQTMRSLRAMCNQLNDAQISSKRLNGIMESLVTASGSKGLIFIRKRYIKNRLFQLEFVASSVPEEKADRVQATGIEETALKSEWWDRLHEHKLVVHQSGFDLFAAENNFVLVPLFCEARIYGLLCFTDFETEQGLETGVEFALTAGQAFELWLSKSQAERRFAELVEFIPNPIMILDTEGVVTTWNKAVEIMSGKPAEEVVGKGNYEHALAFYNERRPTVSNLIFEPDPRIESQYLEFQREGDTLKTPARCDNLPGGERFRGLQDQSLVRCDRKTEQVHPSHQGCDP